MIKSTFKKAISLLILPLAFSAADAEAGVYKVEQGTDNSGLTLVDPSMDGPVQDSNLTIAAGSDDHYNRFAALKNLTDMTPSSFVSSDGTLTLPDFGMGETFAHYDIAPSGPRAVRVYYTEVLPQDIDLALVVEGSSVGGGPLAVFPTLKQETPFALLDEDFVDFQDTAPDTPLAGAGSLVFKLGVIDPLGTTTPLVDADLITSQVKVMDFASLISLYETTQGLAAGAATASGGIFEDVGSTGDLYKLIWNADVDGELVTAQFFVEVLPTFGGSVFNPPTTSVPEPSTYLLFGSMLGLAAAARKKTVLNKA